MMHMTLVKFITVHARYWLGAYPSIILPLLSLKEKNRHRLVRADSHIVIEGFPRSGNTFAVAAFTFSQTDALHIATHLHLSAQVIKAVQLKVPTLLLIRNPKDAVSSLVIRDPHISILHGLKYYIKFYSALLPFRHSLLTATFEEATTDFGQVVTRLNRKFNTSFIPFDHQAENVRKVFDDLDSRDQRDTGKKHVTETHVARPSQEREKKKRAIIEQLNDDIVCRWLKKAEQLYSDFLDESSSQS
ncbi:MAG: hypothetical protein DHS20C09_09130 [marine bacterium B5-7]|nr:MAG: hypothetical protein DHS20C09_09130 [marine bacterium B5-7]